MARRPRLPFAPKFPDCTSCRFFRPSLARAECLECDNGEFFEAKTGHLEAGVDPEEELNDYLKDTRRYE